MTEPLPLPSRNRVNLFGVVIDAVRMDQAVAQVLHWIDEPSEVCRYVVTPNVDHTVMLQDHKAMRQAYLDADMVLPDGFPVIWASKLLGKGLPERVAGSDLVPALFEAADQQRPLRVFLLGAAPGVADRAAKRIEKAWSCVEVVDTYSPPFGFERDQEEQERMLARVNSVRPHLLVVGLGAPKQEIWVHRQRDRLAAPAVLCVGATIDFLAGEKARAPRWVQNIYLEWFYRLMGEPRRLFWRYARDAWRFPQLVWREWRLLSGASKPSDREQPYRTG